MSDDDYVVPGEGLTGDANFNSSPVLENLLPVDSHLSDISLSQDLTPSPFAVPISAPSSSNSSLHQLLSDEGSSSSSSTPVVDEGALVVTVKPPPTDPNPSGVVRYTIEVSTRLPQYAQPNYLVSRRYNDFVWLHEKLIETHPSHLIPPLPGKDLNPLNKFDPTFLSHRRRELEK